MRPMTFQFGNFRCDVLSDGPCWFDGGTMFGIVPKCIWQKLCPSDEHNRIKLGLNSLLVRDGERTVLVETGIGSKLPEKRRARYDFGVSTLSEQLVAVGCEPESVDVVILTHLHFDHCGGNTVIGPDGSVVPAFPNARYVIQRTEWDDALNPTAQTRPGYLPENFLPLSKFDRTDLVEGDVEIVPGVRVFQTGGHTLGHQAVLIEAEGRTLCYPGDVIPTTAHARLAYLTAFDLYPVQTFAVKERLAKRAVAEDWLFVLIHDDDRPLTRMVRRDGRYVFEDCPTT